MKEFDEVLEVMRRLLAPDGCPWDREQTLTTLRTYVLEETYEVLEAIDKGDAAHHCEELGDLLFQVVFQAALCERDGAFGMADVCRAIVEKLVRRHPHVFGDVKVKDADEAYRNWEKLKAKEREEKKKAGKKKEAVAGAGAGAGAGADAGAGGHPSALDGVPKDLPALLRALRVQEKAGRVGFDWNHEDDVIAKVAEEARELVVELARGNAPRAEEELGDMLFSIVNVARRKGLNPEDALRGAVGRFSTRFRYIEAALARRGERCEDKTLAELDAMWDEAKRAGKR
ncbi:MAG: nucleoside triphosphate pyrophosphohydrolase [Deltaproteobacteria bacterium]|nr:nucleoside triphosphate pyrophosphohydrolase [Deltaproteobacteria bacterium]